MYNIPYSGKLSREKTFANFMVLWLFAKFFSTKSGGVASFGMAQASNPRKFSPSKVSRYTVDVSSLNVWLYTRILGRNLPPNGA